MTLITPSLESAIRHALDSGVEAQVITWDCRSEFRSQSRLEPLATGHRIVSDRSFLLKWLKGGVTDENVSTAATYLGHRLLENYNKAGEGME